MARSSLAAVLDTTGSRGERRLRRTFRAVERRFVKAGYAPEGGIQIVALPMPIMGASRVEGDRRVIMVSQWALRSEMLDGLLAHELSHILRTDGDHPSHDGALIEAALRDAKREYRVPRRRERHLRQVLNHVQDIYADDIAMNVLEGPRAEEFFLGWIAKSLDGGPEDRWEIASRGTSNNFAVANLERHGLLARDAEHYRLEAAFARRHGFRASDDLRTFFRELPPQPDAPEMRALHGELLGLYAEAAHDGSDANLDDGHHR